MKMATNDEETRRIQVRIGNAEGRWNDLEDDWSMNDGMFWVDVMNEVEEGILYGIKYYELQGNNGRSLSSWRGRECLPRSFGNLSSPDSEDCTRSWNDSRSDGVVHQASFEWAKTYKIAEIIGQDYLKLAKQVAMAKAAEVTLRKTLPFSEEEWAKAASPGRTDGLQCYRQKPPLIRLNAGSMSSEIAGSTEPWEVSNKWSCRQCGMMNWFEWSNKSTKALDCRVNKVRKN